MFPNAALDCLRFSKLLKLHQIEGRISSNLLNTSNPAGKQASYTAGFIHKARSSIIIVQWINSN